THPGVAFFGRSAHCFFSLMCDCFRPEYNCVITRRQRQFVMMQRALEIPPGNLKRDFRSSGVAQTNTDLGAPLSRMPVAAVHLPDLPPAAWHVGLDECPDGGRALAPG